MKLTDTALIRNPHGLHARPSVYIVETANKFKSKILLVYDNITANAKVILDIMSLGASVDSEIKILVEGEDAQEALKAIKEAIEDIYHY